MASRRLAPGSQLPSRSLASTKREQIGGVLILFCAFHAAFSRHRHHSFQDRTDPWAAVVCARHLELLRALESRVTGLSVYRLRGERFHCSERNFSLSNWRSMFPTVSDSPSMHLQIMLSIADKSYERFNCRDSASRAICARKRSVTLDVVCHTARIVARFHIIDIQLALCNSR